MSRSRLQVAFAALLGLTLALTAMWSSPPEAATADTAQTTPTSTLTPRRVTFRLQKHGGCPTGIWEAVDPNRPQTVYRLAITLATRYTNAACNEILEGDLITVEIPPTIPVTPGVTPILEVLSIEKVVIPTPPSVASAAIDFRGVIALVRPLSPTVSLVQFNTEVSGQISVSVPNTVVLPLGENLTPGRKADVRAQRGDNGWVAQKVQLITESSEIGFSGLIEFIPPTAPIGVWKIAGRSVAVSTANVVTGEAKLYRRATVVARLNGNVLEATEIKIDATDALALTFELKGQGSFDRDPFNNPSTIGSCLQITVAQGLTPPPGYPAWVAVVNVPVVVSGSRPLGTHAPLVASRVVPQATPYSSNYVEILGYIDLRQDNPNGEDVQLHIAGITIQAAKSLADVGQAVTGAVVQIQGQCGDTNQVRATSIAVLSTQNVDFRGTIESSETTGVADIYTIRPAGRNDTQRIFRPLTVPVIGRNAPVVGACIDGNGFYLADSSIQAQRVEVVQCTPAALAPQPSPTPIPNHQPAAPPDIVTIPELFLIHPTPTPRYSDSEPMPATSEQPPAWVYPTSTPWAGGWR